MLAFLFSCRTLEPPPDTPEYKEPYEPIKTPAYSVTLLATGDNLFNAFILDDFRATQYDFTPVYSEISGLIQAADLAFINQETVMAGEQFGLSGYPRFNTPQTLAKVLARTGFTVVNHANNHVLDMGEKGLLATLDAWDAIPEIYYLGVHRSKEKKQIIITKNNISFGFLSYTYGTNGIPLPKDKPWLVSLADRETMAVEIDALRPLCDFLIVSMHWGDEYAKEPSAAQKSLAEFLAQHQVDLIIGHHPHVLQRFDVLPRPGKKNTLCFYSLGNFVSNQERKETSLGGLLYAQFEKCGEELSINDAGIIPVVTHYEKGFTKTKVIPLYAYTDELEKKHRNYSQTNGVNINYFNSLLQGINATIIMHNPFEALSHDR